MSDETSTNDEAVAVVPESVEEPVAEAITPELTDEEKERMEAERIAAEEAERVAAEAARFAEEEAARLAEEKRVRVAEHTIRAHQLIEYTRLVRGEDPVVDQILATLEPEAVEAGRVQVQAEQDALRKQLANIGMPTVGVPTATKLRSKRSR